MSEWFAVGRAATASAALRRGCRVDMRARTGTATTCSKHIFFCSMLAMGSEWAGPARDHKPATPQTDTLAVSAFKAAGFPR